MESRQARKREGWLSLLIIAAVTAAFFPSLFNGFTNFDDNAYLTANPLVRSLAPANLKRIFTTPQPHTVFSPLVTLSFAVEYRLWGLEPPGYHAVNLFLHLLNALLVFFLIRLISRSRWTAFFSSLLFALHPLRVESVAWVTERKDLLSALFLLLALLAYQRYLLKDRNRDFLLSLFLFAAAALAKMSALVLPALLLLVAWKAEGRISKRRLREMLPFIALALLLGISGWISVQAFSIAGTGGPPDVIARNSLWLIPFFLQKTLLPAALSAHYPTDMRFFMPPLWLSLAFAAFLVGGTFLLLRHARRDWLWGWAFFFLTLLPAFGVIWHFFPTANRYSYLPAVGLSYVLVLSAAAVTRLLRYWKAASLAWLALAIAALPLLAAISFQRSQVWKNSLTLWDDVIARYPMIPLAYNSRGLALRDAGRVDEALADYSRAIELLPDGGFYWNRAMAWLQKGMQEEAAADFHSAILADPRLFPLYCRLELDRHGDAGSDKAIAMGQRVLASRPEARIHFQLAGLLARRQRWPEAETHLRQAARLQPQVPEYRQALAAMLRSRGHEGRP